jgi:hypothetical protein
MGSNPIRCSNISINYDEMKKRGSGYCSGKCSEYRALSLFPARSAECNHFCHLVQRHAANKRRSMLLSSATECHLSAIVKGAQSLIHAEGVRCRGCGSVKTISGSSSGE